MCEMSDVIVKGGFVGKVDEVVYENENVCADVSIYKYVVDECYCGEIDEGESILISMGGTILFSEVYKSSDAIVFLKENKIVYNGEKVYSFASISQVFFLVKRNLRIHLARK